MIFVLIFVSMRTSRQRLRLWAFGGLRELILLSAIQPAGEHRRVLAVGL